MQTLKINIKKGLDIPIAGKPKQLISHGNQVKQVALVAEDYLGLKPMLKVQPGQLVGLGEPLFVDKRDPKVTFVSPGTGRVVAINRGRRRKLQSVVIELEPNSTKDIVFKPHQSLETQALKEVLFHSGLWTGFRTRPYDRVPHSTSTPHSIFVTAIDTRPLAADPNIIINHHQRDFIAGMNIIRQLGDWPIYLCTGPDWQGPDFDDKRITTCQFDGPHPAGLTGTHIHHLDPVSTRRMVWHIGYQDVIAIGHLFQTGQLLTERIVSIGGSAINNPRLVSTRLGADINELLDGEMNSQGECRILSGSVLDGQSADGPLSYLGRFHNQISVIPNGSKRKLFGWLAPLMRHFQLPGLFSANMNSNKQSTAMHGRPAAMIPIEGFDRIMPLDILLTPLLRAMLVKDTVAAQNLGCLELAEEDLALSTFICPAKQNYGAVLRINLDQIEQEG